MPAPEVNLETIIQKAITNEVERIIALESDLVAERIKQRVKERAASITATVLKRFSMERFHDRLVIEVRFNDNP